MPDRRPDPVLDVATATAHDRPSDRATTHAPAKPDARRDRSHRRAAKRPATPPAALDKTATTDDVATRPPTPRPPAPTPPTTVSAAGADHTDPMPLAAVALQTLAALSRQYGEQQPMPAGIAALAAMPSAGDPPALSVPAFESFHHGQSQRANALQDLNTQLDDMLSRTAGDTTAGRTAIADLLAEVDTALTALGPVADTPAGRGLVAGTLVDALQRASVIVGQGKTSALLTAGRVNELAQRYLDEADQTPRPYQGTGTDAASLAQQYLGWRESRLQGYGVDEAGVPYGESCANFVSTMLQKSGQIDWHTDAVSELAGQLVGQGWVHVPLADARPGDVWICDGAGGESHTELVAANDNGHVTLIGSNNISSDMQQISYDGYSASIAGSYILSRGTA